MLHLQARGAVFDRHNVAMQLRLMQSAREIVGSELDSNGS
jgi:hypothetical protein